MDDKSWVELCTVSTEIEAELVRSMLESCGIEVLLRASLPTSVYPGLSPLKCLFLKRIWNLQKRFSQVLGK